MKTELSTIDLQIQLDSVDQVATGSWSHTLVDRPKRPLLANVGSHILGVALVLAASPATAVPDYWFLKSRTQDVTTIVCAPEKMIGRLISRAEALRIVRQILDLAERERKELAEWEAQRGIQWDEEA